LITTVGASSVLKQVGVGRTPTIVLGGLVPDSTDQVFLLRRFFLKSGDVYYFNYARDAFSLDAVCAQLDALVAQLSAEGTAPVLFGVSFGAGLIMEWLRRARAAGRILVLAGVVLVSPVSCVADIIAPGATKPSTLIGRALKPFLDREGVAVEVAVEKARSIFVRMFEAGTQNKVALRLLMTAQEAEALKQRVMTTIRGLDARGARARVQALAEMCDPTAYFQPALLPLTTAPALVLFAEREDAVLDRAAPVRLALERALSAYFPAGRKSEVRGRPGDGDVQHASLVFHVYSFLPHLQSFYRNVRRGQLALAA
jgi:pimeloyl-ACP methyl ester carboxylesterase